MAGKVGILTTIFRNIKKTLVVARQREILVGRDHNGNTYYERPEDSTKELKRVRYVERADGDQSTAPDVPVEWMPWLQGKREEPPSDQEIEANYINMMRTQYRAKELEQQRDSLDVKEESITPKKRVPFPTYEDYEIYPGKNPEKEDR